MEGEFRRKESLTEREWKKARRKVLYDKVVCAITQCSVDLRSFDEVRDDLHLSQKRDLGLHEIPLDQIQGSVGRFDDFSSTFLPLKDHMQERWEGVDKAVLSGKTPPIEVYKVDEAYFVVDGNHRVSVARQHGEKSIRAHVTEFVSPFGSEGQADVDSLLISAEQESFRQSWGEAGEKAAGEFSFTCSGCYQDLANQVEMYRQGLERKQGEAVPLEQAISEWKGEVYDSAVAAIREHDLLSLFPNRTEADLFIWAWQNSHALEKQEIEDIRREMLALKEQVQNSTGDMNE